MVRAHLQDQLTNPFYAIMRQIHCPSTGAYEHKRKEYRRNGIPGKNITFNSNVQVLCLWCVCVCEKSLLWADSFSASSHAHEVPPSYCCFYTIFLYVWFTCDAASYIPKALTRRQQQIATNNSAFFSLFFSLRSFVFVSCVLLLLLFSMCVGKT